MGWVGRLISILSTTKKFWFRNVPHHFQIALLPAELNNLYKLWRATYTTFFNHKKFFTAFSSCYDIIKQLVSFVAIKLTKRQSASEWVSDKHNQWSDSGPIKMLNHWCHSAHWLKPSRGDSCGIGILVLSFLFSQRWKKLNVEDDIVMNPFVLLSGLLGSLFLLAFTQSLVQDL